jgi:methyltransferase-like protein
MAGGHQVKRAEMLWVWEFFGSVISVVSGQLYALQQTDG